MLKIVSRLPTLLAGVFCLLMAGCAATGPTYKPMQSVPADKAAIYIYRPNEMAGAAYTPTVTIGDGPAVDLKNGGYFVTLVDPGKQVLVIHNIGKKTLEVDTQAGGSYYVRGWVVFMAGGYPSLKQVPLENALAELQQCKQTNIAP